MKLLNILLGSAALLVAAPQASPCSRIVFRSDSTDVVQVGRTLDWRTPIPTNIYVYPAGMQKQSMNEGPMYKWTSKYGSALAVGYDGGVTEGMNDQGLVMNGLFCKVSEYRTAIKGENTPVFSLSVIVSFFLDNFSTVDEVYDWIQKSDFAISGQTFDGGTVSLLHWGITDRTGNTLILEYDHGKLNTYMGKEYQMLTNDPVFPSMQAINGYWQGVGGMNMLPGGVRSADRFVRGDFFIHHVPNNVDDDMALCELMTVIDNVSVPYGYEIQGQPELSTTQWRSVSDLKRNRYYFKFADSLFPFYVDLAALQLNPGDPVLKLDTSNHTDFAGCVNKRLKKSAPFNPMW